MFKLLLLEDSDNTQIYLQKILMDMGCIQRVDICSSLKEAVRFCMKQSVDLVIIDLGLPDGSGADLIPLLNKKQPNARKLISTVFDDRDTCLDCFKLGVDGYILKCASKSEIQDAVNHCLQGNAFVSPSIVKHLIDSVKINGYQSPSNEQELKLSRREIDVLRLISKGYSYSEIASELNIKYNTASSYIKNLYAKMEVGSKNQAVYKGVCMGVVNINEIR